MAVANPRPVAAPPRRPDPPRGRTPFRDNTRLILFGILVLLGVLAVLLGMTIVPAVLVLLVGSEVIRNSVDRWFNAPMNDVLSSANAIAGDYYQERQRLVSVQAERFARELAAVDLTNSPTAVRDVVEPDVLQERVALVEVYRV